MTNGCLRRLPRLGLSALAVCTWAVSSALAQNENESVGFQTNHLFESGQFGENIDVLNGGLTLTVPIGQSYQVSQNLGYQLTLSYTSKVWDTSRWSEAGGITLAARGALGSGFSLHLGRIYMDAENRPRRVSPATRQTQSANQYTWYYVTPDGNQHALPGISPDKTLCASGNLPQGVVTDTTFYTASGFDQIRSWDGEPATAPKLRVHTPDGMIYTFGHLVQVKDRNGMVYYGGAACPDGTEALYRDYNRAFGGWYVTLIEDSRSACCVEITDPRSARAGQTGYAAWVEVAYESASSWPGFEHAIKSVLDSAGRRIDFVNDCQKTGSACVETSGIVNNPRHRYAVRTASIALPAFAGTGQLEPNVDARATYAFTYEFKAVTNLDGTTAEAANYLKAITYPTFRKHDGSQGSYALSFTYNLFGELESRVLPTGASVNYAWRTYFYTDNEINENGVAPVSGITRELYRKYVDLDPANPSPLHEWLYTRDPGTTILGNPYTNPRFVTVQDPAGNETVYSYRASLSNPNAIDETNFENGFAPEWDDGLNHRVEYYQGSGASRTLVRTEVRDYEADTDLFRFAFPARGKRNVRMSLQVTIYDDDEGRRSTVSYSDWDGQGHYQVMREAASDVAEARMTRTIYLGPDPERFLFREVSDGRRVIRRTDKRFSTDGYGRLESSIERATLPARPGTPHDTVAGPGDIKTCYRYDSAGNVTEKEVTDRGTCSTEPGYASHPHVRVRYGWQAGGYLATKEFFDWSAGRYYPWRAIDRSRDGNTGLIFRSRDSAGIPTAYTYDVLGRVYDILPPSPEHPTQVEYVSVRQTAVRQGDQAVMRNDYACAAVAGDYVMTCYDYDALGRLLTTRKRPYDTAHGIPYQTTCQDVLGRTTFQTEWTWLAANGRPYRCDGGTRPPGTAYDYADPANSSRQDPFGRARRVMAADGRETRARYFGQTSEVTVGGIRAPGGDVDATTTYFRDGWGRLTRVVAPPSGGANAAYAYDLRDNLIEATLQDKTTLKRQVRAFEYDALNRLRSSLDPESGATVITGYDSLGNVTERLDAPGNRLRSVYDSAGRLTEVWLRDGAGPGIPAADEVLVLRNTYDEGAVLGLACAQSTSFGCSAGRLTRTESWDDAGAWVSTRELHYTGLNGRVSRERNYLAGWTGSQTLVPVAYEHNPFGLVSRLVYPEGQTGLGGAFSLFHGYANGYLTKAWDPSFTTNQATATYNAAGGYESVTTFGNVTTRIPAEVRNRPERITVGIGAYDALNDAFSGGTFFRSGPYEYDGAGNVARIGQNQYRYDTAGRLVQAEVTAEGTYHRQTYRYDDYGNLTQKVQWDASGDEESHDLFTVTDPITKRNTNRILFRQWSGSTSASFYSYDARGNLTGGSGRSSEFDARSRLIVARTLSGSLGTDVARYAYDGASQRVRKEDQTRDLWLFHVRDSRGRLLSEFRRTKKQTTLTPEWSKHYIYFGDRLVGLRENMRPSPPAGLKATTRVASGSASEVRLTWSANPKWEGVTGYTVYRSPQIAPPAWTLLVTTSTPGYADATTATGTWYQYSVKADKGGSESYRSDVVEVEAGDVTPPGVPQGLQARPGDGRVDLSWQPNPPEDNLVGYHVYGTAPGQKGMVRITAAPVPTPFAHLNLANGSTYRYAISAVDNVGLESARTDVLEVRPADRVAPSPPQGLTGRPDCSGQAGLAIEWSAHDPADGVARYLLYREPAFAAASARDVGTRTSHTDTEVTPGVAYTYWVEAVDAAGNTSQASSRVVVAAPHPSGGPPAPGPPAARSGDGTVSLRVAVPKNLSPAAAMRLYRKLNAYTNCDGYEALAEFGAALSTGQCTTGQICPGGSGCPAEQACSSSAPGVPGVCAGSPCATRSDCPSGQACWFRWGEPDFRDFQDGGVPNNAAYDYAVTNVDADGRESALSPAAIGTPVAPPLDYVQCVDDLPAPTAFAGTCPVSGRHRQLVMRWQHTSAEHYQPLSATPASGALGYLKGYRVYRYDQDYTEAGRQDKGSFDPLKIDSTKAYCEAHPDTPCRYGVAGDCPSGDLCVLPTSDSGRCPFLSGACVQDGDCRAGGVCRDARPDPYLVLYGDARQFAYYPGDVFTDCVTVKAVYKVFANGGWLTVESDPAGNFDAGVLDPTQRCSLAMPDICAHPGPFCPAVAPLPPTPAAPAAVSSAPGEIVVSWQAPAGGETIAGYHLYVIELDGARYHFTRPAPFTNLPPEQTSYIFRGLSGQMRAGVLNRLQFRVGTFDVNGRASEPSALSETVAPMAFPDPLPPPLSVKVPVTASVNRIGLTWLAGGVYTDLKGYRVYRSQAAGGPYCALLKLGAGNPPGVTVCGNDVDGTPGIPNAASTEVTATGTGFGDGTVLPGADYYYVVVAVTTTGQSQFSQEVVGRTLGQTAQPLSPPTFFRAWAPDAQPGIHLRWCPNQASEAVTGYRLYRATGRISSGGPYTFLVEIPPACLDGSHRCEIGEVNSVPTLNVMDAEQNGCVRGIDGTCGRILDRTVRQPATWELLETQVKEFVHCYVVTAYRETTDPVTGSIVREESGYSMENSGWPNYFDGTSYVSRYDPDNFPETPCGVQSVSLGHEGPLLAGPAPEALAPYRTVAGKPGPKDAPPSPETPPAQPRFVYFHLDHLGSPRVITDGAGAVVSTHHYMPYGEELPLQPMSSGNSRQFTGHERDAESGLDYALARYYASSLARFVGVDPDGANPANPQSWNKYAYALNNPVKFLDISGRYAQVFLGFMQRETTSERKAGLNQTARQLQGDGVKTGTTRGPGLVPGSLGRRADKGASEAGETDDKRLELVGFSRGAIAARDAAAALDGSRSVDLLLMIEPELRSNLSVPGNVKLAIHVSNGSAKATAQDPSRTTVINLDVPKGTDHVDMDDPNSPQMGFARDAARLADEGKLTPEEAEKLAKAYGLKIQQ